MSNKLKLLWISQFAPYDTIDHAGGKVHNYQIKFFNKSNGFDIHLLTLSGKVESKKIDLEKYNIKYDVHIYDGSYLKTIVRKLTNINSLFNPYHRLGHVILTSYYNALKSMLYEYAKENIPEVVILQWTGVAMLIGDVKRLFPNAKVVVIEEDVSYLGKYRMIKNWYTKAIYDTLKRRELDILNEADLVVVNNTKDKALIIGDGIDENKIFVVIPYFDDYGHINREYKSRNIVFFGNMSRMENQEAAMWLIDNVMSRLDSEYCLEIVGSRPSEELIAKQSERVKVRGFVEKIDQFFAECLCMVAPLHYGAGIKIKVIEAMSARVPVITTNVGIEGINAKNHEEYIHADSAEEYIKEIQRLGNDDIYAETIGNAAGRFIQQNFNIDKSLNDLINVIESL